MGRKTSRRRKQEDKIRKRLSREKNRQSFLYHQVDSAWKKQIVKELKLHTSNIAVTTTNNAVIDQSLQSIQLSAPTTFHATSPNGNCFFNALSFIITGNEACHYEIRKKICNHLLDHVQELKTYLPATYGCDAHEYLRKTKMFDNGTWATEVEIFSASHMLKTSIYVYTKHGVHWKWLRHAAYQNNSTQSIYLFHKGLNHYDVVLGIGNAPVISEFSENMQKYFIDQLQRDKCELKKNLQQDRYKNDEKFQQQKKMKEREKYRKDKKFQQQRKMKEKEKYRKNEKFQQQKKTNEKQKYRNDEKFQQQKKMKEKQKYSNDEKFQQQKKITTKLRYHKNPSLKKEQVKLRYMQNLEHREKKKIVQKHRYHTDDLHCEQKKKKNKERQNLKYKLDVKYKEYKKRMARKLYATSLKYREYKRNMSILKYATNSHFRHLLRNYSKFKYREDTHFCDRVKGYSTSKYKHDEAFLQKKKARSRLKYKEDDVFRESLKKYSTTKYRDRQSFRYKVTEYSKRKYRCNSSFAHMLRVASRKKYASNPFFRNKLKKILRAQYHSNKEIQIKKKESVKQSRKNIQKAINLFRKNTSLVPAYTCTVCARLLYKNQVKACQRAKYKTDSNDDELISKCLTGKFIHSCIQGQCREPCTNQHAQKEWICYTCDSHLAVGNMPPQAYVNGMELVEIPKVLKELNSLERQLVALRIPFMKLLSLPKGGQKGVKGQVVNVPADLNSVTTILPRTINDAQMVRVKLKRKLSYSGHHQYEWVNPRKVVDALQYLTENNFWYKNVTFQEAWYDPVGDSDIVLTPNSNVEITECDKTISETCTRNLDCVEDMDTTFSLETNIDTTSIEIDTFSNGPGDLESGNKIEKTEIVENEQPYPIETCFQPLDLGQEVLDTDNKIFCVAPGEGQKPQNIFQEKGSDAMAFPILLPNGKFGVNEDRKIKLSPSKYFNARLFSADDRFAKTNQFIFFAQYMVELNSIRSSISIALRKGKDTTLDKKITASMLTNTDDLQKLLKSDIGYRFLQPVRGTPPYWERTMKDLFAMIRQLGIPTWFVTFSAGETRWEEVITCLLRNDGRPYTEVEWLEKCKLIKDNPVMCARLFNNRVKSLFTDLILSPAQPVGQVVDYFFRTEFQQRGSPHIHCLLWVKDAPKLDVDPDELIVDFVDKYICCKLPDKVKDPELYEIVSAVQMHSKSHTKSCKKGSTTCRFRFPRPPIKKTFIARIESTVEEKDESLNIDKKLPTKEEFDKICAAASGPSAKEIIKSVWTVINNEDNLENQCLEKILQTAHVTYTQFQKSLEELSTKNTIFHQRNLTDSWVNNYNGHLLRAWNANLDIQFVMDAYSCVAYILSYISKSEAEVGELLQNAKQEAKEGNKDAAAAMKYIGQTYIQNREVSAQEAVYRVCGMHLKECSRDVVFIPTGKNCMRMSLPITVLKSQIDPDASENIWMTNIIDKYLARPQKEEFEEMSLAEFCSFYTSYPKSRPPKKSTSPGSLPVHTLQHNMGYIKKRMKGKEAIIRYPRFNRLKASDEYYHTLLQLYVPHRQSMEKPDEYANFEEFVKHGQQNNIPLVNIITAKRKVFEKDAENLEKAWEDLQAGNIGEDAWAMLAPESEAERLEHQKNNIIQNDVLEDVPEMEIVNKESKSSKENIYYQKPKVSKREILSLLAKMNKEQQLIFYKIRQWALKHTWNEFPEPFHIFVTGGAGTGKSHLIKCIYHEITRIFSKISESPEGSSVLLTAPTGTAAFNIGGMTLHSAFSINKRIKLPYVPLGESILNTLRKRFQDVQLLIIDEISMVDHKLLTYIHGRLCQIRHSKKPFGNISVVAVGDFYQLPPVKASPLYKLKDTIILDLWNPLFKISVLTEIMRQKEDKQFPALLNRVREHVKGQPLNAEDIETLKSVAYEKVPDNMTQILHIFPTNKQVAEHNEKMVDSVCNPCIISHAKDYYKSTVNGQLCPRDQPYASTAPEDLPDFIKLGIGSRIMLTRNIDTEDGLVNGAFGTIKAIEQRNAGQVKSVYVKFDNDLCGKNLISKTPLTIPDTDGCVKIVPIQDELSHKNALRQQLPLKLGFAATIHKVQGMTAENIVVSLKHVFQAGMAYVALSRATSLKGLNIIDLDVSCIYSSEEIKQSLQSMTKLFPEEETYKPAEKSFTVVMHNTEGILPHIEDIKKVDIFSKADIVCLTETWLEKDTYIASSILPDSHVYSAFRQSSYSSSHPSFKHLASLSHGGVSIFVNKNIRHNHEQFKMENLEFVFIKVAHPMPLSVICIYRPPVYPTDVFARKLQHFLSTLHIQADTPIIILGDFNDNFLAQSHQFVNLFHHFGYKQLVKEPTTESGTCLDLIFTNLSSVDIKVSVIPLYYSFHDAVAISIPL